MGGRELCIRFLSIAAFCQPLLLSGKGAPIILAARTSHHHHPTYVSGTGDIDGPYIEGAVSY